MSAKALEPAGDARMRFLFEGTAQYEISSTISLGEKQSCSLAYDMGLLCRRRIKMYVEGVSSSSVDNA